MASNRRNIASFLMTALALAILIPTAGTAEEPQKIDAKTALVIIDVQEFYFPGGFLALDAPEAASQNCKKLLEKFRGSEGLVVHVGHKVKNQGDFHVDVKPLEGEKIVIKDEVSAFNGTDLTVFLKEKGIERVVICGMQTHMCVEGAVRAAYDLGFKCVIVGDACATKDLNYEDTTINAADVHNSTLSSVHQIYGTVIDTETFLKSY
jgi:nicotinamidase-related amidase